MMESDIIIHVSESMRFMECWVLRETTSEGLREGGREGGRATKKVVKGTEVGLAHLIYVAMVLPWNLKVSSHGIEMKHFSSGVFAVV